ncbi:hypothetical protein jhhlp_004290 [Lomentospora prolificans]|uniref:Uncharacterized protein n=1 Tax=Lomentospora prolificans TaxID=41688 RepID=A0A2N3NB62_9PEZI|nr:hypothetical protein jhhlp_004290 [Lomentospora prolificans]
MATIALTRPIHPHRPTSASVSTIAPSINLDGHTPSEPPSSSTSPTPVPNKHIPTCPPGPIPLDDECADTDQQASSPSHETGLYTSSPQTSLLFPPVNYGCIKSGTLSIYTLSPSDLVASLEYSSQQPLPDPADVFPWFHGVHPQNHIQQTFFTTRHRASRATPQCLRGVTVVKADGDLTVSRLKGAISPEEFMQPGSPAEFIDIDPREGFSVRNFHIQAAKAAMTSDIVVYGEDNDSVTRIGWTVAKAQRKWRQAHEHAGQLLPEYNTFVCVCPFNEFEEHHYNAVAVDSKGNATGNVLDFFIQERTEMYCMAKASEISHNVWLGPTPYPSSEEEQEFDILIECSDLGHINPTALQAVAEGSQGATDRKHFDFPSSGSILPPTWSHAEADGILETCKWIYHLAHGTYPQTLAETPVDGEPDDGKTTDPKTRPLRILLHCADGYTESTMLAIAYFSYITGRPVPDAWLALHTEKGRNFFAYPADVALLSALAPRLLQESPVSSSLSLTELTALVKDEPAWFTGLDGSFPSRILDYMYLGNLGHASNPELLRALGIGQVLSVGETALWRDGERDKWGENNLYTVECVQDNGIDPLTDVFDRCLEFIDHGRRNGTATLVHCRVGVSRSATICIAEVMRRLGLSFPRAYCFVRARRLNVIIQPHLRFVYELLKWEETLHPREDGGSILQRELEWAEIAREIALMNRPYANR